MIFRIKLIAVLLCVSVLVVPITPQDEEPAARDYAYTIGAKDLLTITVFEVPELNITVRVSEDGDIALPLLGIVKVEGLNRLRLEQKLAAMLEKSYLKNAQVTVFIKEYQSQRVSVMGAVKNAGTYELIGRMTLLQILSQAGGLSGEAGDRIVVIRQYADGSSASLVIDIEELMVKGTAKFNIPLQAGDIVNVPVERFMDVFVFGQVNNPGQIKMKLTTPATLLRAIAQAGGFTERARKGSVLITRREDGKEKKIKVNVKQILGGRRPDFELQANDVVYVKESVL